MVVIKLYESSIQWIVQMRRERKEEVYFYRKLLNVVKKGTSEKNVQRNYAKLRTRTKTDRNFFLNSPETTICLQSRDLIL